MKSINRKSNIQLGFFIILLKHKPCRLSCQQFFKDRIISTNIRNRILVAAKLKHPRKLQETHVWGNPCNAPIVLLREVYRFCCCCPTCIFSLDFLMLVQDLGKFQTHRCMLLECITMSAFSSNFNLPKKFRTFDFRVWILSLQIYNFISVSQTQIGQNVDKLNNVYLLFIRFNVYKILTK